MWPLVPAVLIEAMARVSPAFDAHANDDGVGRLSERERRKCGASYRDMSRSKARRVSMRHVSPAGLKL